MNKYIKHKTCGTSCILSQVYTLLMLLCAANPFSTVVVLLYINIAIFTSGLCKLYVIYFAHFPTACSVVPPLPDLQSLSQMILNTGTLVLLQDR